MFFRPFKIGKGSFRETFMCAVATRFDFAAQLLQIALHIGVWIIGMKALEQLPDVFRVGVRVVGATPQLGQAFGLMLLRDRLLELPQTILLLVGAGRTEQVARRMPTTVIVPLVAHCG